MTGFEIAIDHPRLRRFYEYWLSKCGPGKLPGRRDIDPVDIPELLPWMILIDPVLTPDGPRFRVRLVGTAIVTRAGRDTTGQWFEDLFLPQDAARFSATYREIMRTGRPHHAHTGYALDTALGQGRLRYERLLCPLAADGVTVDMLAGVVAFED